MQRRVRMMSVSFEERMERGEGIYRKVRGHGVHFIYVQRDHVLDIYVKLLISADRSTFFFLHVIISL